ncbi:MAG: response regulator [Opitutae bacterium]|nr:response regulator [Opitutae bacterium]
MTENPQRKPALLLLEDEAELAAVTCVTLDDEFEIETAANVAEARLLLASRQFDVLVCDHLLPGRAQGLDFLVEALTLQPKARRILLTGYMNPELISRSVSVAQLSACLIKPISPESLRRTLHEILALDV